MKRRAIHVSFCMLTSFMHVVPTTSSTIAAASSIQSDALGCRFGTTCGGALLDAVAVAAALVDVDDVDVDPDVGDAAHVAV